MSTGTVSHQPAPEGSPESLTWHAIHWQNRFGLNMAAHARVAHHTRGRLRIQIRSARHNPRLAEKVKQAISSVQGVQRVDYHPATGSFILHYTGARPKDMVDSVADRGHSSGLYDLTPPAIGEGGEMMESIQKEAEFLAAHSKLARLIVEDTEKLDQAIKVATDNNLDLRVIVPLALAACSVGVFGADLSTPLWATLGIFSFNSFVALHARLPVPSSEGERKPHSEPRSHS